MAKENYGNNNRRNQNNRNRQQNRQNQQQQGNKLFDFKVFDEYYSGWIKSHFDDKTISFAENFGKHLARTKKVSTSQIRNIFAEIQRIKLKAKNAGFDVASDNFKSFLLLKPKMAYVAQKATRDSQKGLMELKKVLDKAHTEVVTADSKHHALNNFCDLFEAIIAYHKANGAKK